jgi:ABC-type uncharacterized transport system auxiliary subunit
MLRNKMTLGKHVGRQIVVWLCVVLVLSACSSLNRSDKPASTTWWLEPYTDPSSDGSKNQVVKLELKVSVVPGLDSHRILTLSDTAEVNKYAAARWADSLPELFESLVRRSLGASGQYQIVSRPGESEDCRLELELQEFFAKLDAAGRSKAVIVSASGRYLCPDNEPKPIKLTTTVAVHDDHMSGIVAAFQTSFDSAMQDLLDQM